VGGEGVGEGVYLEGQGVVGVGRKGKLSLVRALPSFSHHTHLYLCEKCY
jgi:hypothetical protein